MTEKSQVRAEPATSLNRRRFLKTASVATISVGFPTLIPASALGADGHVAASNRIVMAFIGIGSQGGHDLSGLVSKPETQLVAVCDVDQNHLARGKKIVDDHYGNSDCATYTDFREMFSRGDLDAVGIALPDHWHAIVCIAAARTGLDIHNQKPLARTIYEGRQMVNAVRRYGRVFQTGSQQRSAWEFRHACELVRSGYIGEIKTVYVGVGGPSRPCPLGPEPVPDTLDYDMWLGPAPWAPYHPDRVSGVYGCQTGWRAWEDYSGGLLTDWGAHHFDIAQWGLDMDESGPVEVYPPDGKEFTELTYRYASGIPLIKQGGPYRGSVQFIGTQGWVGVSRGGIWSEPESLTSLELKPDDVHLYESRDHKQDFLNCIRTRRRPICDVETGHRSITVSHIGWTALRLNRPLKWDPETECFLGDEDANRFLHRAYREPWQI